MKDNKLFDAISDIDEDIIKSANKRKTLALKPKKALLLCAVIGILAVVGLCVLIPALRDDEKPEPPKKPIYGSLEYIPATIKTESAMPTLRFDTFDTRFLNYIDTRLDGNYMVSPLSLRYALGMLVSGATGETKEELLNAFDVKDVKEFEYICSVFNGFQEKFETDYDAFIEYVEKYGEPDSEMPERALKIANSVWRRNDLPDFKEGFASHVGSFYRAGAFDFTPDTVAKRVNEWANENTKGMIPKVLNEGEDYGDLAVVLANALYFKDSWKEPFSDAGSGKFTKADESVVTKDYIVKNRGEMNYYSDKDTELVSIPMEHDVYMAFVLGSTDNLSKKFENAQVRTVNVKIPKMEIETSLSNGELVDFLKEYGVSKAFTSGAADFSDMIDDDIYVSDIIQKTKIKLDKTGVEAAAVTLVLEKSYGIDIEEQAVDFTADRPFSFFIYSDVNNVAEIMFAGKVAE